MRVQWLLQCAFVVAFVHCNSEIDSGDRDDGGRGGSRAGAAGSAGAAGRGSGGASGEGGTAGRGGNAGGSAGTAGANTGDAAAGAGGSAGQDAGSTAPIRSAGCGRANPAVGNLTMDVQANAAQYFVSVPSSYDPNTAYRLGFGFHGRNRTHTDCKNGDCAGFAQVMQERAVLVYMKSLGGTGWEGSGERTLNLAFFGQVLAALKAGYCIDERRVFVAGTSSGAHFTNLLACLHGDQLQAFSPVAGVLVERNNCRGNPSGVLIHGVDDSLSQGIAARDFFRTRNGCSESTVPAISALHARVVANRESHECAEYQGCRPGQQISWCEHSEGGYDGSTHGWPKFGGQVIWDFVSRF